MAIETAIFQHEYISVPLKVYINLTCKMCIGHESFMKGPIIGERCTRYPSFG